MVPFATWNAERDVWETDTLSLFSEHLDVFSETWPTSGMTRSGTAYTLAANGTASEPVANAPAHPTAASESLSLLPTPSASLGVNGGSQPPDKRRAGGHLVQLAHAQGQQQRKTSKPRVRHEPRTGAGCDSTPADPLGR